MLWKVDSECYCKHDKNDRFRKIWNGLRKRIWDMRGDDCDWDKPSEGALDGQMLVFNWLDTGILQEKKERNRNGTDEGSDRRALRTKQPSVEGGHSGYWFRENRYDEIHDPSFLSVPPGTWIKKRTTTTNNHKRSSVDIVQKL